jgi:hypothetical protein
VLIAKETSPPAPTSSPITDTVRACRSAFFFAAAYPISGLNVTIVYNGSHPAGFLEGNWSRDNNGPSDATLAGLPALNP